MLKLNDDGLLPRANVVSDAKSVTTALGTSRMSRERNLVPDLQRLRTLRDSGTASFYHVTTHEMVADALTKPARDASVACAALARLAQCNDLTFAAVHLSAGAVTAVAIDAAPADSDARPASFFPLY